MTRTLLIAKNDFEGIASLIVLNTIFKNTSDFDMTLCKYETNLDTIDTSNYSIIFVVGIKDISTLKRSDKAIYCFSSYDEVYEAATNIYTDTFNSYNQLAVFCKHAKAYLDWSWQHTELYYGKNIDELSKYYNKIDLINTITDRIINGEEIITSVEKQIIIFSKKIMSNYIEKNNYYIIEHNGKSFACSYCENHEIELANKILKTTDVDAVILVNLNINLIRIKTREKDVLKDVIINMNGHVNNNGGTLKISDDKMKAINSLIFEDILNQLNV